MPAPIMPHYVNIALGNFFGHVFLPVRWRSSLLLAFYSLIPIAIGTVKRKNKSNVLQAGGAKSVTEKITEGHGSGEPLPKMRERMEDFWELRGLLLYPRG